MRKWHDVLNKETIQIGLDKYKFTEKLREEGKIIFPESSQVFRALQLTPPDLVKVCIVGQDPYYTEGAANGLAFSINKGRKLQPSLENIFKELSEDIGCSIPKNGDLTRWAEQGVLLLNTCLTVEEGKPLSHANIGWETFTYSIYEKCLELPQPIVFILWGSKAQRFTGNKSADKFQNKIAIRSAHPSPLSAYRGFFGSKPFSTANKYLIEHGIPPIDWKLM